jgi:signal transduction histidine kinase
LDTQNARAGIGLIGMGEMPRLVGGTLVVKPEPEHGTEILAEVALSEKEDHVRIKAMGT